MQHPDAHQLGDMQTLINRPISHLLWYELQLKALLDETPQDHSDQEDIPPVLDLLKGLLKEFEPGVESAEQKVELWRYSDNLKFRPGEVLLFLVPGVQVLMTSRIWIS